MILFDDRAIQKVLREIIAREAEKDGTPVKDGDYASLLEYIKDDGFHRQRSRGTFFGKSANCRNRAVRKGGCYGCCRGYGYDRR
jgi:hypothetical protein